MGFVRSLISLHKIHNCSIMLYHYTTHLKLFPFFHNSFQNQLPEHSNVTCKVPGRGFVHKEQLGNKLIYTISIFCWACFSPPFPPSLLKVGAFESWKEEALPSPHPSAPPAGPHMGASVWWWKIIEKRSCPFKTPCSVPHPTWNQHQQHFPINFTVM